ncbi:unnamed protein product [Tetraodon nigroviridis]|uniref:(spotted green pufferfish) hypothetical protein n=1 Tax=Tetraodon nigroviridis TaxID=99883 RepID=Q4TE48_TETNG|nr:unnamed protein product [Tetraodon nigroviridis]
MAAIPSSGSLVATHDYYRRRLGSASSSSSCGSAEIHGRGHSPPPRAPQAGLGSLVDLVFLRQTEPARPAEWLRPPEERNLHSGQRPGDLHRQGDGSEATAERNQRRREARAAGPPDPPVLDPPPPPRSCRLSQAETAGAPVTCSLCSCIVPFLLTNCGKKPKKTFFS